MKRQLLSFFFFLSIAFIAFAQNSIEEGLRDALPAEVGMSAKRLALLDAHIQKYIGEGTMPGGVFLVARKGKIVYYKNMKARLKIWILFFTNGFKF